MTVTPSLMSVVSTVVLAEVTPLTSLVMRLIVFADGSRWKKLLGNCTSRANISVRMVKTILVCTQDMM